MQNTIFTPDEIKDINKYGFGIRKNFSWKNHIQTIVYLLLLSIFSLIPGFFIAVIGYPIFSKIIDLESNFSFFSLVILSSGISIAYPLLQYIFFFIRSGVTFFTLDKKLEYGNIHEIGIVRPRIYMENLVERIGSFQTAKEKLELFFYGIIFPLVIPPLFLNSLFISGEYESYTVISELYYGYLFFIFLFIVSISFFRSLYQSFHPLYAFGNLGEKIQSLTPEIESQSKQIQENFEKDMNFGVLHSGFEKLSSTFSQIISLVLKLENIEKKANKGNLFDSTKYINSLRSDILIPLTSLKLFLEKQKQELKITQQELSRVRVGGSEEESANTELASKRSESLMVELEKNISFLDEMIERMRK